MGSQRRLIEALKDKLSITGDDAYQLMLLIEDIEIGDSLADAIYTLESTGNAIETIKQLTTLHQRLGVAIQRLDEELNAIAVRKKCGI